MVVGKTLAQITLEVMGESLVIIAVMLAIFFSDYNLPIWSGLPVITKSLGVTLILFMGVSLRAVASRFSGDYPAWRFMHDALV